MKKVSYKGPRITSFHLYEMSTMGKPVDRKYMSSCLQLGAPEGNGWLLKGTKFLSGVMKNAVKLIVVMVAQVWITKKLTCTLHMGKLQGMWILANKAVTKKKDF